MRNNNINFPYLSNGDTSENENENDKNNNYNELIKKNLLKFNKKNNNLEYNSKEKIKLQTFKNISKSINMIENRNKKNVNNFNLNFKTRKDNKSKTIKQFGIISLSKNKNNNFFKFLKKDKNINNEIDDKTEKEKINDILFSYRNKSKSKRNSFSNKFKAENNIFNSIKDNSIKQHILRHFHTKNYEQLPNLNSTKTERINKTSFLDNNKIISNSVKTRDKKTNFLGRNKNNDLLKNSIDLFSSIKLNNNQTINIINKSNFYKNFHKKKTFNDLNQNIFSTIISNKLLSKNRNIDKNNKFLNKLKKQLDGKDKIHIKFEKKNLIKEEINKCLTLIENKVDKWMLESPLKNSFDNDQKIIFDGVENKKYKKKEKRYIRLIIIDFIKKISSTKNISINYLNFHKGIIEKDILRYIRNKFFDIFLPSCLFENNTNALYLHKLPKKNFKKMLLRKKTIDAKKMKNEASINSLKKKKFRRLSTIKQERNEPFLNNIIPPLNETEKKYIHYFNYLDIDLDEHNEHEDVDKSFLKLLKGNLNSKENQEKLINKFLSICAKNTKYKSVPVNRKNSIKNLLSKYSNDSPKIKRKSLFKNNFFSRNEIKRTSYNEDNVKKKKSLLEYNLLFDPNLTGYNNLEGDPEIIFEPNTERTIINKKKFKEIQELKNKQLTMYLIASGGMKTDKNIYVMKTLDLKNQYNHRNKGNINSLTSSIKDCNYDSFVKFYRTCNCGPNAFDKEGNSLLSLAVKSSCTEIVNFLLDEKANPNLQNVNIYII